jgi:vacuolar-type H+-ATPase subunit E/Vma4
MSDDIGKDLATTASDIGKSLTDAANSEQAKKAEAQAQAAVEQAADKAGEALKKLQKDENVKKAEEQAQAAAEELGKGLKSLGGFLKKKADEVTKK